MNWWYCWAVSVSQFAMVVRSPFAIVQRSSALISGLVARVAWVVRRDRAGRAGVMRQGIGSRTEDLAGKMLERLTDALDDF